MIDSVMRVLVVDDDSAMRRLLHTALTAHGYTLLEADTGRAALEAVALHEPDVVILDLGLPDMDGLEVTRMLRGWTRLPIIALSVRDRERDKIAMLDAGADDYLTKPFAMGELLARLRVVARHVSHQLQEGDIFTLADLTVDFSNRIVRVRGDEVPLTPTEYALLRVLITHAGKVITHTQLLQEVWGPGYEREKHLLRVNISNLRSKLEAEPARPQVLFTEPGVGYRLGSTS